MKLIKKIAGVFILLVFSHLPLLLHRGKAAWAYGTGSFIVVILLLLLVMMLLYIIRLGIGAGKKQRRLRILLHAKDMINRSFLLFFIQLLLYLSLYSVDRTDSWYIADLIWMLVFQYTYALTAAMIIFCISRRLRILRRILLWMVLFLPIIRIPFLLYLQSKAKEEYDHETIAIEVSSQRVESQICKTRYPLLMLHGVGFRDLKYINYWGRIPRVLTKNGATVYYGNQEAFAAIEQNSKDIQKRIEEICAIEQCDKVNIIAHSKGGLDARHAISKGQMGAHVASLTTISTPHRGCRFVDVLIKHAPEKLYRWLASVFDKIFLGMKDLHPDFYTVTHQFTTTWSAQFNEDVKDDPQVYYQSYMSLMHHAWSHLLLTIPYLFIRLVDAKNDGLVTEESAKWGDFQGTLTNRHYKGISHGNIIDLTREDYKGFDVLETYVQMVAELKRKGF